MCIDGKLITIYLRSKSANALTNRVCERFILRCGFGSVSLPLSLNLLSERGRCLKQINGPSGAEALAGSEDFRSRRHREVDLEHLIRDRPGLTCRDLTDRYRFSHTKDLDGETGRCRCEQYAGRALSIAFREKMQLEMSMSAPGLAGAEGASGSAAEAGTDGCVGLSPIHILNQIQTRNGKDLAAL